MAVLGHHRRRERERQSLYARRNLQSKQHRSLPVPHLAVPAPASGEDRRRLRRVASLENAGRPSLTRITTTPHALRDLTLRGVVRGSHTFEPPFRSRSARRNASRFAEVDRVESAPRGCCDSLSGNVQRGFHGTGQCPPAKRRARGGSPAGTESRQSKAIQDGQCDVAPYSGQAAWWGSAMSSSTVSLDLRRQTGPPPSTSTAKNRSTGNPFFPIR